MRSSDIFDGKVSKFKVISTIPYWDKPNGTKLKKYSIRGHIVTGQRTSSGWVKVSDGLYLPVYHQGMAALEPVKAAIRPGRASHHRTRSRRDTNIERDLFDEVTRVPPQTSGGENRDRGESRDRKSSRSLRRSGRGARKSTDHRPKRKAERIAPTKGGNRMRRYVNNHFRFPRTMEIKSRNHTMHHTDKKAIVQTLLQTNFGSKQQNRAMWDKSTAGPDIILTDGCRTAYSFEEYQGVLANKALLPASGTVTTYSWEVRIDCMEDMKGKMCIGVSTREAWIPEKWLGLSEGTWSYHCNGWASHSGRRVPYGEVYSQGDVIGIEIDMARGTILCFKSRTKLGQVYTLPKSMLNKCLYPAVSLGRGDKVTIQNFTRKSASNSPVRLTIGGARRGGVPRIRPDSRRRTAWAGSVKSARQTVPASGFNPVSRDGGTPEDTTSSDEGSSSDFTEATNSTAPITRGTTPVDRHSSAIGGPSKKLSASDMRIRQSWKKGDEVEVYSFSKVKWMKAKISHTFYDAGRKWVEAFFDGGRLKKDVAVEDIESIRPLQKSAYGEGGEKRSPSKISATMQQLRKNWKVNSEVLVFSNSLKEWFQGKIVHIYSDSQGEWLRVSYGHGRFSKEIHRNDYESIRPTDEDLRRLSKTDSTGARRKSLSKNEELIKVREAWKAGDEVEVFSQGAKRWIRGEIREITNDHEGEWMVVFYKKSNGQMNRKEVKRFSKFVRPVRDIIQNIIKIKSIISGKSIDIPLPKKGLDTTVGELKQLISEQEIGFRVDRQRLSYTLTQSKEEKGNDVKVEGASSEAKLGVTVRWLDDNSKSLKDLGVPIGASLHLLKLGLVVFGVYKTETRVEVPLPFGLDTTVAAVKSKILGLLQSEDTGAINASVVEILYNSEKLTEKRSTLRDYNIPLESVLIVEIHSKKKKKKESGKGKSSLIRKQRTIDYYYMLGLRRESMDQRKRELKEMATDIELIKPIIDIRFSTSPTPPTPDYQPVPSLSRKSNKGDGYIGSGWLFFKTAESKTANAICRLRVVPKEVRSGAKGETLLNLAKNASNIVFSSDSNKKPIIGIAIVRNKDPAPANYTRLEIPLQKSGYLYSRYNICVRKGVEYSDQYHPEKLDKYPAEMYSDYPREFSYECFAPYCFPNGVRLTQYRPLSLKLFHSFRFYLGAVNRPFYGAAMTIFEEFSTGDLTNPLPPLEGIPHEEKPSKVVYCPKCLVLIAEEPFYQGMHTFLDQLYNIAMTPKAKRTVPVEAWVYQFFNHMPRPMGGIISSVYTIGRERIKFSLPPPVYFPGNHQPMENLFKYLEPTNVVRIYELLLAESQILLVSSDASKLTNVAEAFRCLLYPFTWERTWIPLLPADDHYLHVLIYGGACVIGVEKTLFSHFRLPPEEEGKYEIIDLDKNEVKEHTNQNPKNNDMMMGASGGGPRKPELPWPIRQQLLAELKSLGALYRLRKENMELAGTVDTMDINANATKVARLAFLRANIHLLWGYQSCLDAEDPRDEFLKRRPKDWHPFYKSFLGTQIWQQFCDFRGCPDFSDPVFGASKRCLSLIFFDYCMAECAEGPSGPGGGWGDGKEVDSQSLRSPKMKIETKKKGGTQTRWFGTNLTWKKILSFEKKQLPEKELAFHRGKEVDQSSGHWNKVEVKDKKATEGKEKETLEHSAPRKPKEVEGIFGNLDPEILARCPEIIGKIPKEETHPMEGNRLYEINPNGLDHWLSEWKQTIFEDINVGLHAVVQLALAKLREEAAKRSGSKSYETPEAKLISSIYELWFKSYLLGAAQRMRTQVWLHKSDIEHNERVVMEVQKVLIVALGVIVRMLEESLTPRPAIFRSLALFCAYCQTPHELQMVLRLSMSLYPVLPTSYYHDIAKMVANSSLHIYREKEPSAGRPRTKHCPSKLPLWMRIAARCETCRYSFSGEDILASFASKGIPAVDCPACFNDGIEPVLIAKTHPRKTPERHKMSNPVILEQVFEACSKRKKNWTIVNSWEQDPLHEFRNEENFAKEFWNIFWYFASCSLPYGFLLSEREEYLVQLDASRQYNVRTAWFQSWSIALPGVNLEYDRIVGDDAQQLGATFADELPQEVVEEEMQKIFSKMNQENRRNPNAPRGLLAAMRIFLRERQRTFQEWTPEWHPRGLFYGQSMLQALYPISWKLRIDDYTDSYTKAYNTLKGSSQAIMLMDSAPTAQHRYHSQLIRVMFANQRTVRASPTTTALRLSVSRLYSSNLKELCGRNTHISPAWRHLYSESTFSQNRWCPAVAPGTTVLNLELDINYERHVAPAVEKFSRNIIHDLRQLLPENMQDAISLRVLDLEPNTLVEIAVEAPHGGRQYSQAVSTGSNASTQISSPKSDVAPLDTLEISRQLAQLHSRSSGGEVKDRSPKRIASVLSGTSSFRGITATGSFRRVSSNKLLSSGRLNKTTYDLATGNRAIIQDQILADEEAESREKAENMRISTQLRQIVEEPVTFHIPVNDEDNGEEDNHGKNAGVLSNDTLNLVLELAGADTSEGSYEGFCTDVSGRVALQSSMLAFKILVLLEKQGMIHRRNFASGVQYPSFDFVEEWEHQRVKEGKWSEVNLRPESDPPHLVVEDSGTPLAIQEGKLPDQMEWSKEWTVSEANASSPGWLYARDFHQNFHAGQRALDRVRKRKRLLRATYVVPDKETKEKKHYMVLFERQRNYGGAGWSSKMLPNDGYSWSVNSDGSTCALLGSSYCLAPRGMKFDHGDQRGWELVEDAKSSEQGWIEEARSELRYRRWYHKVVLCKPGDPADKKLLPGGDPKMEGLSTPPEEEPYVHVDSTLGNGNDVKVTPITASELSVFLKQEVWKKPRNMHLHLALQTHSEVHIEDITIEEICDLVRFGQRLDVRSKHRDRDKARNAALADLRKRFYKDCDTYKYSLLAQKRLIRCGRVLVQEHLTHQAMNILEKIGSPLDEI